MREGGKEGGGERKEIARQSYHSPLLCFCHQLRQTTPSTNNRRHCLGHGSGGQEFLEHGISIRQGASHCTITCGEQETGKETEKLRMHLWSGDSISTLMRVVPLRANRPHHLPRVCPPFDSSLSSSLNLTCVSKATSTP